MTRALHLQVACCMADDGTQHGQKNLTEKAKDKTNNKTKEVSKYCALIHWSLLMDDWLFWLTGSWRIRISCRSDCCRCVSHFYKSAFMGLSRDIWEPIQPSAAKKKSNRCLTMVITITVIGANWHHIIIIFCLVNGRHDYFSCANYSPMWRCYQLWATVILNIMNLLLSLYYYYSHFSLGLKRKIWPQPFRSKRHLVVFIAPLWTPPQNTPSPSFLISLLLLQTKAPSILLLGYSWNRS